MTAKTTKPKCVLLDANVVIEAHRFEAWHKLTCDYEIVLPSIVVHDEALYYSRRVDGIPVDLDLPSLVERGTIVELAATAEELAGIFAAFDCVFIEQLDPGEIEALALLQKNKLPGAYFCTADAPAIRALAMLGMADKGISMQTLLAKIGLRKRLLEFYNEAFFKTNLCIGSQKGITGEGLAQANSLYSIRKAPHDSSLSKGQGRR